jgi:hypothetical protein
LCRKLCHSYLKNKSSTVGSTLSSVQTSKTLLHRPAGLCQSPRQITRHARGGKVHVTRACSRCAGASLLLRTPRLVFGVDHRLSWPRPRHSAGRRGRITLPRSLICSALVGGLVSLCCSRSGPSQAASVAPAHKPHANATQTRRGGEYAGAICMQAPSRHLPRHALHGCVRAHTEIRTSTKSPIRLSTSTTTADQESSLSREALVE